MRDIVDCPIFIRLGARMRAPAGTPASVCRRINISNVVVHNAHFKNGCIISGLPGHNIEDVELSNIQIQFAGGGTREMANRQVEEYAKAYPEPQDFGTMPSYGFFFRHVKGLRVHDLAVSYLSEEQRPPFVLDDVEDATFHDVSGQRAAATPVFRLSHVRDLTVRGCKGTQDAVIPVAEKKEL
jgi:hypothetical protein